MVQVSTAHAQLSKAEAAEAAGVLWLEPGPGQLSLAGLLHPTTAQRTQQEGDARGGKGGARRRHITGVSHIGGDQHIGCRAGRACIKHQQHCGQEGQEGESARQAG